VPLSGVVRPFSFLGFHLSQLRGPFGRRSVASPPTTGVPDDPAHGRPSAAPAAAVTASQDGMFIVQAKSRSILRQDNRAAVTSSVRANANHPFGNQSQQATCARPCLDKPSEVAKNGRGGCKQRDLPYLVMATVTAMTQRTVLANRRAPGIVRNAKLKAFCKTWRQPGNSCG